MRILYLVFICFIIVFLRFYNKKKHKIKRKQKHKNKDKDNNNLSKIYLKNDNFYNKYYNSNNSDLEILNKLKSRINRQSIISQKGGSKKYNKLKIESNISGNKIIYTNEKSTYTKLPFTHVKI